MPIRALHFPDDPDLDVVDQLKAWIREVGLEPRPGCTKRQNPSEGCRVCPPLFPLSELTLRFSLGSVQGKEVCRRL